MAFGFVEPMVALSRVNTWEQDYDYGDRLCRKRSGCAKKLCVDVELLERSEATSATLRSSFSYRDFGGCVSETRTSETRIDVQESRDDESTATKLRKERLPSSLSSSTRGWGMGYRRGCRLTRVYDDDFGRQRGSNKPKLFASLFDLLSDINLCNFTPFSTAPALKIDRRRHRSDIIDGTNRKPVFDKIEPTVSSASTPKTLPSTRRATSCLFPVIVCILFLISGFSSGHAFSSSCVAEQCAGEFMRALDHDKVLAGSNLPYCTLLSNYRTCLNRTSRACRGDLKYHSLNTMVLTQIRDRNCAVIIEIRRKLGTVTKSSVGGKIARSNATLDSREDESGGNGGGSSSGRCLFPYQHQKGTGGYRYCSMFGDPHLRTFEGQYETCRTLGAWPLMDNAYFGVQVTNDPVADGVDASGISKVTVIVKSLPGCTDQKMFEATRDSLPSTFVDGTTNSGEPNTNSISGSSYYVASSFDNRGGESENRPSVVIRTTEVERHIEINLRYISTRLVIRRVGNYLTVAIKIPEEVLVQRSSLNSLQLCLTGCPSTERINYKEVLAYPDYYVKKWGARSPAMNRDQAMDVCRQAGVTDFFFDSCVFDLLMTGDESFKDSAFVAMQDIRTLYPPYKKHYETRRSDLALYDELAKLGRELEDEERVHGQKRRQPGTHYWNPDQQQSDQRSAAPSTDGSASSKWKSRTNSSSRSTGNLIGMVLLLLFIAFRRTQW